MFDRRRPARSVATLLALGVLSLGPVPARAQPGLSASGASPDTDRPRLSLAIGMGASFDDNGLAPRRTEAIPSFFATGGFGDGFVGLEVAVFSSSASGRYRLPDSPCDRQALEAFFVLRPLTHGIAPEDRRYVMRLLRTVGLELGGGFERDALGQNSQRRFGFRAGGRVEFPISLADDPGQLRLRLAVRRFYGTGSSTEVGGDTGFKDSTLEAYAALAVVF